MISKSLWAVIVAAGLWAGCGGSHQPPPEPAGSAAAEPAGSAAGSASGSATPTACEAAGGKCVGLTPTACADGKVGDANQYSCGGGVGVECCLPK